MLWWKAARLIGVSSVAITVLDVELPAGGRDPIVVGVVSPAVVVISDSGVVRAAITSGVASAGKESVVVIGVFGGTYSRLHRLSASRWLLMRTRSS